MSPKPLNVSVRLYLMGVPQNYTQLLDPMWIFTGSMIGFKDEVQLLNLIPHCYCPRWRISHSVSTVAQTLPLVPLLLWPLHEKEAADWSEGIWQVT